MSAIRSTGVSSDELIRTVATGQARSLGVGAPTFRTESPEARLYQRWLAGKATDAELRATTLVTKAENTPGITYSAGDNLGFIVPMEYHADIVEGMKLADPLLDSDIVTVIQENDYSLRPLQVPGWDLSSVKAVKVGENVQESAATIPTLNQPLLNKFGYRTAFDMSQEFEEDALTSYGSDPVAALSRAQGIAIARGVGADLVNGDGATGPQGIVTGATDSGIVTANTGSIVHDDLSSVFYAVNRIYRNSPKCGWLVSDAVEKQIRNAKDTSNRPLFPTSDGVLQVFGKPVYVCPSLPLYNPSLGTQAAGSFCVFGDLSHYVVHASAVLQRRFTQSPGLIEFGKVRFHSLILVDAVLNDPTSGASAPIVSARLKA
jgi:HK97 family phage major capsid protein